MGDMSDIDSHKTKFHALLQEQIYNEFTAAQQYVAIAVYCDGADLPQLAKYFYGQAVEERNHAMMLVQYLLDRGAPVEIPGTDTVRNEFATAREAVALALDSSAPSPSRSPGWPRWPATRVTTSASSSCSGSSRSRSRRSPR